MSLRALSTAIALTIFGFTATSATAVTYQHTNVSQDYEYEEEIRIDGDNVVWQVCCGSPYFADVFRSNGITSAQLDFPAGFQATFPQLSGNNVTWFGWDGVEEAVYYHDGTTPISLGPGQFPQISGNHVVWQKAEGGDKDIFLYDGTTTTQLSTNTGHDRLPHISGSNVVWEGYDGTDWEIFHFDGTTTSQLTSNNRDDADLQIDGNNVVWRGYDGNDWEIFYFDGTTTTQLTNNNSNDTAPELSGTNVTWSSHDGNDHEIFLYDGTSTTQLTNNSFNDTAPDVSGNFVTWEMHDGHDKEIMLFDGVTTTQLTNNDVTDDVPQVSGDTIAYRSTIPGPYNRDVFVATPIDTPATPSFSLAAEVDELTIDFGTVALYDSATPVGFDIANYLPPGALITSTARMNLTDTTVSGNLYAFDVDLSPFHELAAGSEWDHFEATLAATLPGTYAATYEIEFTDLSGVEKSLTLNLEGVIDVIDDPSIPNLVYNAATGEVILDADASPGIIGYRLLNDDNAFLSSGHTSILAGVTTSEDFELSEAAFSTGSGSIGLVLPTGMSLKELARLLSVNEAITGFQQPTVPFDLIVIPGPVPEPSTYLLGVFALVGLSIFCRQRRR